MARVQRAKKQHSAEEIARRKALAERLDREEAAVIRERGRAVFEHHERLRSILQLLVTERQRQGLSLADIAEQTDMAKSNLSRLENSEQMTPTLETIECYARAVGKTMRVKLIDAA